MLGCRFQDFPLRRLLWRRSDGFIVENGESAAAVAVSTLRTPIACCERACVSIEVL
jgi:hypothetical protein